VKSAEEWGENQEYAEAIACGLKKTAKVLNEEAYEIEEHYKIEEEVIEERATRYARTGAICGKVRKLRNSKLKNTTKMN
jgi:hypothetical protein